MSGPRLDREEARQGKTGQQVRYVLLISTAAAILALAIVLGVTGS